MLALLAPALIDYSVNGRITQPNGNRMAGYAPRGVYSCRGDDRWIALSVTNDRQWRELVQCLSLPERPEWQEIEGREKDQDALDSVIAQATAAWEAEALMAALQPRAVPAGVVQNARDLVELDPQLRHRDHWRRLDHPEMGWSVYNGPPFAYESGPIGPRSPAPLLGQHTDAVCRDLLGLDDAEIEKLKTEGVLT
jgi:benzylsuccinate CoA-transferase BbsF subunit